MPSKDLNLVTLAIPRDQYAVLLEYAERTGVSSVEGLFHDLIARTIASVQHSADPVVRAVLELKTDAEISVELNLTRQAVGIRRRAAGLQANSPFKTHRKANAS